MRRNKRRGSSLIELSLICPWFLFLFVGIVDCGFFYFTMISVENAARIGAEYTSKNPLKKADQVWACNLVRAELAALPGVTTTTACTSLPLIVTAAGVTGPDSLQATKVTVQYQGGQMIPIPGLLMGRLNITRSVTMRVKP